MAFGSLEPTYSVAELGREIRDLLAEALPSVWVAGELQRLKSHANGHLYFELVEKGDGDQIVGRLDGVLWRGDLAKVRAMLARTGQQLTEGMAIRSHRYDGYPYYLEALRTRGERYNAQRARLWEHEAAGDCLVIAPEKPVEVKVNEHVGAPLLDLYLQGRRQTEARLDEVRAFMAGD